ncbi:lmo0954 family membrane protein [Neobacillus fumarioli]|uniref:lmo0954 family membrane protein n=1 Tax=Neobacillus fumarioli TaxID=105229 RepID=UPI0008343FBC|nr:flagellar basal body rod protein [Neobacillus fumarioli]
MKKLGLLFAGGVAAAVLFSTIGPMVGLAVSAVVLYFLFKQFLKTDSLGAKIGLAILGLVILLASIHNIPAIIGVAAACVLYLVYKKWNQPKYRKSNNDSDPFVNFEKQWHELSKKA